MSTDCEEDDELDLGLVKPKALDLDKASFESGAEYVRSFVRETRQLHRGDVKNEERKT